MNKCIECQSDDLIMNGELTCRSCGLVLDKEYYEPLPAIKLSPNEYISSHSGGKYIDENHLGSVMFLNSNSKYKLRKLKKINRSLLHDQNEVRIFYQFKRLLAQADFEIPRGAYRRTWYLFRKYLKSHKDIGSRRTLLMCVCLLQSIREFNVPVTFKEVVKAFRDRRHRVSYNTVNTMIHKLGISLGIRKPHDYIDKIVSQIADSVIVDIAHIYKIPTNRYLQLLRLVTREFLNRMDRRDITGRRPYELCVGIVYIADRLIAITSGKYWRYSAMTHENLQIATGTSSSTIRDHMWLFLGDVYEDLKDEMIEYTEHLRSQ